MTLATEDISTSAQTAPTPPEYNEVEDKDFKVELVVNPDAKTFVFHTKPFRKKLSWLEFDLNDNRLDFVTQDGDVRNFGLPVSPELAKYMQNASRVLLVLMDEETGEALEGAYVPLIVHRA